MAVIAVNELRATGAELFQDSESFLNELNNVDNSIYGGSYSGISNTNNGILEIVEKGFQFAIITYGIDYIAHLVKSFSDDNSSSIA